MKCVEDVKIENVPCNNKKCRYWLNYPFDLNCTYIAIEKNGEMKLQDVGDRLHLTYARIKQLETQALIKVKKRTNLLKVLE